MPWFSDNQLIFDPESIPTPIHCKSGLDKIPKRQTNKESPVDSTTPKENSRMREVFLFCCGAAENWKFVFLGMFLTILILFSFGIVHLR